MRNNILRICLLGLFVLYAFAARSQNVGINTTAANPVASAVLDLNTGNTGKVGFLAPQVSLASINDVATIPAPATGLIVYNKNAALPNGGVGYYYFNGATWILISNATGNWVLTGNSNTAPATNWIGTNDANALQFKLNGFNSGWLDYLATSGNAFLGYQAGMNNTTTFNTGFGYLALSSNTTGQNNTAFGSSALALNSTGSDNSALGDNALANTTGVNNTAIGYDALKANTSGHDNTAIGAEAAWAGTNANNNTAVGAFSLNTSIAGFNTAIGDSAGFTNFSGSANTYIGSRADASGGAFSNSTAVGANAYAGASNVMVLGSIKGINKAQNDVNVGIGTNAPTQKLHINNGSLLISNSAIGGDAATVGAIELQGPPGNAGITSIQAGAQGATNFNYLMPIVAPTVGYLLEASTYAAPNVQLGYNTQPSGVLIQVDVITTTSAAPVAFNVATTFIVFKIIGGGGAGGGADFTTTGGCIASTASVSDMAGTGGGAGGYSEGQVVGINALSTYSVNIGAGGVGQAACGQPAAGDGGATTLTLTNPGIILSCPGGKCGLSLEVAQSVGAFQTITGGAGGLPLNAGALNVQGGTGGWGNVTQNGTDACESGTGASSIFGGGGSGFEERDVAPSTGNPASAYGAGGSGGTYPGVTAVNSTCTGGNGSPGIVIIYEYQ